MENIGQASLGDYRVSKEGIDAEIRRCTSFNMIREEIVFDRHVSELDDTSRRELPAVIVFRLF